MEIIDDAERSCGKIRWTIGGGTMLNDMFGHQDSKDIDIFVPDPQFLLFLTPRVNATAEAIGDKYTQFPSESGYRFDFARRRPLTRRAIYPESCGFRVYIEASNVIKICVPEGEIDFIVAPRLTEPGATSRLVGQHPAMVETAAEILAKNVFYRASDFTARVFLTWHSLSNGVKPNS